MRYLNLVVLFFILVSSFLVFYYKKNIFSPVSKEYIGILIFFFATITGVFMARQGRRYNLIVKGLTDFNGNLSFQYRDMEMFNDKKYQKEIGEIIKKHYHGLGNREKYSWDEFLNRKSSLLTDINFLHIKIIRENDLNKLESHFMNRSQASLLDMHKIRKNLVPLINEKIPFTQWVIIFILAIGLVFSFWTFNSQFNISESFLKSIFTTSVFAVILILFKMNNLTFYEETPGKSSAQDVLDIIDGKK